MLKGGEDQGGAVVCVCVCVGWGGGVGGSQTARCCQLTSLATTGLWGGGASLAPVLNSRQNKHTVHMHAEFTRHACQVHVKDGATCCIKKRNHNTLYMLFQYAVVDIYPDNAPFPLRARLSAQNVPAHVRQTDGQPCSSRNDFLHVNMTLPDKSLSFLALCVCVLVIMLDRRNYRLLQRRVCGCSIQSHAALKGFQL